MASPQTIQPSTADTMLQEAFPTANYNGSIGVSPLTGSRKRSLVAFDFSAMVPPGATITLATLSLYCSSTLASRTITVYRLLRTNWGTTQATWTIYKTGSNWGTAGALNTTTDITTTDAATAASVAATQWLNETVTAQVQTALDSVAGVAHFCVADVGATATGSNAYASRTYGTTARRPKLYIEYTGGSWPSAVQTVNGLAKASVKTRNGLAIASIKSWDGLA